MCAREDERDGPTVSRGGRARVREPPPPSSSAGHTAAFPAAGARPRGGRGAVHSAARPCGNSAARPPRVRTHEAAEDDEADEVDDADERHVPDDGARDAAPRVERERLQQREQRAAERAEVVVEIAARLFRERDRGRVIVRHAVAEELAADHGVDVPGGLMERRQRKKEEEEASAARSSPVPWVGGSRGVEAGGEGGGQRAAGQCVCWIYAQEEARQPDDPHDRLYPLEERARERLEPVDHRNDPREPQQAHDADRRDIPPVREVAEVEAEPDHDDEKVDPVPRVVEERAAVREELRADLAAREREREREQETGEVEHPNCSEARKSARKLLA